MLLQSIEKEINKIIDRYDLIDELADLLVDDNHYDLPDIVRQGLENYSDSELENYHEEYALELR